MGAAAEEHRAYDDYNHDDIHQKAYRTPRVFYVQLSARNLNINKRQRAADNNIRCGAPQREILELRYGDSALQQPHRSP